jgi:hypothetical protein
MRGAILPLPQYAFMACAQLKHRCDFTLRGNVKSVGMTPNLIVVYQPFTHFLRHISILNLYENCMGRLKSKYDAPDGISVVLPEPVGSLGSPLWAT